MPTLEASTIQDKALELCHFIADAPEFADAHEKIKAFLSDDAAKAVYCAVLAQTPDARRMP